MTFAVSLAIVGKFHLVLVLNIIRPFFIRNSSTNEGAKFILFVYFSTAFSLHSRTLFCVAPTFFASYYSVITIRYFTQLEIEVTSLNRQLDEMRSQTAESKKAVATARSDQQKIDDLQRKLRAESDVVAKMRKQQQELKQVRVKCLAS